MSEIKITVEQTDKTGDRAFEATAYGYHGGMIDGRTGATAVEALRSLWCGLSNSLDELTEATEKAVEMLAEADRD